MSKMDADAIDFQVQSVSAKTMMLKIADEFSVLAKEKNIRLRVRANDICVQTDPLWLERVLRNLLSNALRYTEQGSVLLSVRKRSGSALIQVWDTGVGIPEESIDEIFNEFTQLKIPVINGRVGLGLGLSIVHRLCKLMGHDISVNSTINKGSVFSLTLALGQEAPANRALEYAVYAANHSLEGKCILVADDEAEVRQAMQMMLQKWGCRVLTADSFESAVRQIESEETLPDALVTDYRFADQNTGLDLVKHIEAAYSKRVPVLMVTGDTSVDNVRQFKASGVRVLHKPVQQAKIRMMLDHLCKEPSVSD